MQVPSPNLLKGPPLGVSADLSASEHIRISSKKRNWAEEKGGWELNVYESEDFSVYIGGWKVGDVQKNRKLSRMSQEVGGWGVFFLLFLASQEAQDFRRNDGLPWLLWLCTMYRICMSCCKLLTSWWRELNNLLVTLLNRYLTEPEPSCLGWTGQQ